MKKARVVFSAAVLATVSVFLTSVGFAQEISESDFKEISSMVSENWSDDYIGYMSLTVGSDILETDGKEVKLDAVPVIKDGTVMLPIRAIVEESGGSIDYNNDNVTIEDSGTTIEMNVLSDEYTKNDENKVFSQAPYVSNGRTYVPLRNITEDLGFEVEWESGTKTVRLTRDFQTMRVIASGNIDPNQYGAKDVIKLSGNVYVMQFDSIDDAKKCCDELENDRNVKFAEADKVIGVAESKYNYDDLYDYSDLYDYGDSDDYSDLYDYGDLDDYYDYGDHDGYYDYGDLDELLNDDNKDKGQPNNHLDGNNNTKYSYEHLSWGISKMGIDNVIGNMTQTQKNNQVIVAVIDTGVDSNHEYLRGKVLSGYDFINNDYDPYDDNGHGTHVAGTVCDVTQGLNVKILPVKVLAGSGSGTNLLVASGIQYAVKNGAKVLNLSLSAQTGNVSEYLDNVVSQAVSNDVCVVVAAGNSSADAAYFCPAHNSDAITVSAIDSNYNLASFSNYGNSIDVAAPGVDIYSCIPNGSYASYSGTSMASPHVAGVCAVLKTIYPNYSAKSIESVLKKHTYNLGYASYFGSGMPYFTGGLDSDDTIETTTYREKTTEATTRRERTTQPTTRRERTTQTTTYREKTTEATTMQREKRTETPTRRREEPTTRNPNYYNYPYSGGGISLGISTNSYSQNGVGKAVVKITASALPHKLVMELDGKKSEVKLSKEGNMYSATIEIKQRGNHYINIYAYDKYGNVLSSTSSSFSL